MTDVSTGIQDRSVPAVKHPARERLLAAADELFYAEGVQSVGIDRVIERAGVAKASLYNSFRSKDELVNAYLTARADRILGRVHRQVARYDTARERLLAVFEAQALWMTRPGYRGCAFASAAAEAKPGSRVEDAVGTYRRRIRALLVELSTAAGVADAEGLALRLHLVFDGAALSGRLDRTAETAAAVAAAARELAVATVDAALAERDAALAARKDNP